MKKILDDFQQAFAPLADAGRAQAMRAYMKDRYDFLGISAPDRRKASAAIIKDLKGANASELMAVAGALWSCKEREYQYTAVDVLVKHHTRLEPGNINDLLALVQQKSWWDTVDGLAGVVGDVLRLHLTDDRQVQANMDAALGHTDFWVRRIALLHQLGWREKTDTERLFHYALALAHEKEFFIRKATGWALRDYAWHDPALIRDFLTAHKQKLSTLTCREAGKNLLKLGYSL
ncbi:DNA alkylation repair protein [Undibacterium sp. TJN19]|uniref:DNA alkylation repair protein n=1 Tax=Undibacterium sp. TJN19 TaxID=3413055 RepID=UPI003BF0E782